MLNLLHRNTAPLVSRVLRPGDRALLDRVERYPVPGVGSVVVEVSAGDRIEVRDSEGGQPGELFFCDASGRFAPEALGQKGDGAGEGLKAMLAGNGEGAARTLSALRRRNIDMGAARAVRLFGAESRAGASASFVISRDGLLIVAAPGADMSPEAQDTATGLELFITRAAAAKGQHIDRLPEPLADPIHDIRIRAATASAYLVRAGE